MQGINSWVRVLQDLTKLPVGRLVNLVKDTIEENATMELIVNMSIAAPTVANLVMEF